MARFWTCQGCGSRNPRVKKKCPTNGCKRSRPALRQPAHLAVLRRPYEWWVGEYGETCGICGRPPTERRKLDRDHCHKTGKSRGLLCAKCNRQLSNLTEEWLENALAYLRRT